MLDWVFAYGTLVFGALFTAGALYKEAEEYLSKKKTGKPLLALMFVLTLLLLLGGIYQTHQTRVQAYVDKEQAAKDRKALEDDRAQTKRDRAVSEALLADAKERLQTLQDKVSDLQTKAETQELSKQLVEVKHELTEAESKLQTPKAKFAATFATPYYNSLPIIESDGERLPDGSVRFSFGVINTSDVAAGRGSIILQLCDACSFASEPTVGFIKSPVSPDTERIRDFAQIQEHTVLQDMTAMVFTPLGSPLFVVGIMVKCENCEPTKRQILTIRIPSTVSPDFGAKQIKPKTAKPFNP
jgi:hypothetical protein